MITLTDVSTNNNSHINTMGTYALTVYIASINDRDYLHAAPFLRRHNATAVLLSTSRITLKSRRVYDIVERNIDDRRATSEPNVDNKKVALKKIGGTLEDFAKYWLRSVRSYLNSRTKPIVAQCET